MAQSEIRLILALAPRRHPELEEEIFADEYLTHLYACVLKGPSVLKVQGKFYFYASENLHCRWPAAERTIMSEPYWAYRYAKEVIKGRWLEAEPGIIKDPSLSCLYALNVVKGRWPEAEKSIRADMAASLDYMANVLGNKWPPD